MAAILRRFRVVLADDGEKIRPHAVLGRHTQGRVPHVTALPILTRRVPIANVFPGLVPLEAGAAGLENDSVVTLDLSLLTPSRLRSERGFIDTGPEVAAITDHVRALMGLPSLRDPDGPVFLQHLPPPRLRAARAPGRQEDLEFLRRQRWTNLRRGLVYRDHGWHPAYNAVDRFFLVISEDDLHERFPSPIAWVVPVAKAATPRTEAGLVGLPDSARALATDGTWYADARRVYSMNICQRWFLPCPTCGSARSDRQRWRVPVEGLAHLRNCVRCDEARAEWPEPVAPVSEDELGAVRGAVAAFLGVV